MATNENQGVKSLQDLASDAFFKEIVYKATPAKVESIRDWTDQQLIGRVKKDFRENCVRKLNQISNIPKAFPEHQGDVHDLFVPLDCLLDDNFVQLAIIIPLPLSHFFSTLMSIISNRCPSLKELEIGTKFNWAFTKKSDAHKIPHGSFCFNQLTSLTLKYLGSVRSQRLLNELNQSVLGIIGQSCPALISLETNGFCITTKDIFGLVVGEWADTLFAASNRKPWNTFNRQPKLVAGLQVPPQLLNPICFTLQEMHIKKSCRFENCNFCRVLSSWTRFAAAFSLRHLQMLRVAEFPFSISYMISFLHDVMKIRSPFQADFEEFCKEVASDLEITSPPSVLSGLLPLREVEVSINDEYSLQAVGEMFPNLAHVCFVSNGLNPFFAIERSPAKLPSILRGWPKLNSITLFGVDHTFVKPIMDILGPTLKKLELHCLEEAQLSDLAACSQLEELTIKRCRNLKASYPTNWSWATFLPLLKSIKSECCIGDWAPSFERNLGSLIAAKLSCCHIGTDGHNPRLEWDQLPELWPLLESLEVQQCSGLTIDVVSRTLPQLGALRSIKLPRYLFQQNLERATEIQEYFASKSKPVQIEEYVSASSDYLLDHRTSSRCPFQLPDVSNV